MRVKVRIWVTKSELVSMSINACYNECYCVCVLVSENECSNTAYDQPALTSNKGTPTHCMKFPPSTSSSHKAKTMTHGFVFPPSQRWGLFEHQTKNNWYSPKRRQDTRQDTFIGRLQWGKEETLTSLWREINVLGCAFEVQRNLFSSLMWQTFCLKVKVKIPK